MRHFPHNSRQCGKCFRETEEFLSYRVLVAVFQCDRIFGRDSVSCHYEHLAYLNPVHIGSQACFPAYLQQTELTFTFHPFEFTLLVREPRSFSYGRPSLLNS